MYAHQFFMNRTRHILFSIIIILLFYRGIGQDVTSAIRNIDQQLKTGERTITQALTADSLMYLHAKTPFREMIRKHAAAGHFSMCSNTEPGTRVTINGSIKDKQGNPIAGGLVYVYQTSDKGWYSDTAAHILLQEGDMRHARLFAYFKTDEQGRFSYETIKPKGYPRSGLAAHIHIHIWNNNGQPLIGPGELQFDDDPRLTPERRKQSEAAGYLVSKNTGSAKQPVYGFPIVTR